MFSDFIAWTTLLHETDRVGFALITVATMAVVGIVVAAIAELLFKALKIGSGRADPHP